MVFMKCFIVISLQLLLLMKVCGMEVCQVGNYKTKEGGLAFKIEENLLVENGFILKLMNDDLWVEALRFQSSYNAFKLNVIDLNGDGQHEFLLIRGEGEGTSVRTG